MNEYKLSPRMIKKAKKLLSTQKNCVFLHMNKIICNNMKLNCIKEVIDEKGISQTWLAKKLDKSFNTVNAYVHGKARRM